MARIIHFGEDGCHRLMVLESAGYTVVRCETIQDIEFYLRSPDRLDAIVISGEPSRSSRVANFLVNGEFSLPVILFAGTGDPHAESNFDLVIPALTSPSDWLTRIEETIERFHVRHTNLDAQSPTQYAGQTGLL